VETVVGAFRDPQFGPVIMFGLGGVHVEALDDVVFRLAPVGPREARAMLGEIRGHRLLGAGRGRPAADAGALADLIAGVSVLAAGREEIAEPAPTPGFARGRGAAVADARIVVA